MNKNESWCKLPYAIMQDERLTIMSAVVYAVMLDRSNGEKVKITAKKVAELTGLPGRTVERAIKELKDTGYIESSARGQNGIVTYALKRIISDKHPRPKSEQPERVEDMTQDKEQLTFDIPEQAKHTFETDFTPSQVRTLSELLAKKLPVYERTPKRVDELLRSTYDRMMSFSKGEVADAVAYMKTMIDHMETKPESESQGNSNTRTRKKKFDVKKYEEICINNYEVI